MMPLTDEWSVLPKGGRGGRLMPSTGVRGRDGSGRAINNFDLQAGRATQCRCRRPAAWGGQSMPLADGRNGRSGPPFRPAARRAVGTLDQLGGRASWADGRRVSPTNVFCASPRTATAPAPATRTATAPRGGPSCRGTSPDRNALAHARGRNHAGAFAGNESGDMWRGTKGVRKAWWRLLFWPGRHRKPLTGSVLARCLNERRPAREVF